MPTGDNQGANAPMISIRNIYKAFGQNAVLKGINLDAYAGDVVALIGGNGAGKSTLMKILMGVHQPDDGEIFILGEKVNLSKPTVALAQGIYLVPQEPMLFPNMTVEENIVIGFSEKKAELHQRLTALITKLGWSLKLDRKADSLSIAEQELVEILRGLLRNSRILILDEPTSALTFNETKSLFKIIKDLRESGISIFYITHRLTEVFEIATQVFILRDGTVAVGGKVAEFTKDMLIRGLLPPNTEDKSNVTYDEDEEAIDYENTKPVLELKNYTGYGFSDLNLKVYPGEILGVAGVVGAGRTEFATTIFGMDQIKHGNAYLNGENITGKKTEAIIAMGLNYVPEDRHLNAIFPISDVAANITSAVLPKMKGIFLNKKREKAIAKEYINNFRIKVTGQDQLLGSLSGGNQQKVVIAKTLATEPKIVILDEPTRGIDASARGDVYKIIDELKEKGVAVLLISSDIEEVVQLSDRAVTMFQGCINHTFSKSDISIDNLMAASFGVYEEEKVV